MGRKEGGKAGVDDVRGFGGPGRKCRGVWRFEE